MEKYEGNLAICPCCGAENAKVVSVNDNGQIFLVGPDGDTTNGNLGPFGGSSVNQTVYYLRNWLHKHAEAMRMAYKK